MAVELLSGSTGAAPTPGNGSKGTAVSLTSPTRDVCGLGFTFVTSVNNRTYFFDLMSGSDVVIGNIALRFNSQTNIGFYIPGFYLPAGISLGLRSQSNTSSSGVTVQVVARNFAPGDRPKFIRGEGLGVDLTNTLVGVDVTCNDTWVEIEDSALQNYTGFIMQYGPGSTNPTRLQNTHYTAGIGGSGSEAPIGYGMSRTAATGDTRLGGWSHLFECDAPAGSRLAVKASAGTTTDVSGVSLLAFR